MIRLLGLLCLCLMCLFTVPAADAQSPSDEWEIPQIECGEDCRRWKVVDEAGNLYILIRRSKPTHQVMLYVIQRGSSEIAEYDMLQLYPNTLGIRTHLAPFANGKIVIFNYQRGIPLTLLDLGSSTVIPLEVDIPGRVEECNIFSHFTLVPSIYRIGTNRILFCSRADDIGYLNIARLGNDTLVLEHSIEVGENRTPGFRFTPPWLYLTSSLDGKVYIVPYPETLLLKQLAPQYASLDERSDYPILRFDPITGAWDSFVIETGFERWVGQDIYTVWPLVGVDADGNLYFSYLDYWAADIEGQPWDLVKYGPQGQKVWHLTEADFGGELYFYPILVSEDSFISYSTDLILRYIIWEEN